jgi:tRNA pseudouridine55 synthase
MNSYFLLLNKDTGITSFDALKPLKRVLKTGKVGHTGTLDKFASGLLVILTGGALKLSQYITGCDKKYEAVIRFGAETDTLDPEGKIIHTALPPDKTMLETALPSFLGKITQIPPLYSAIHIEGKRAHEIARSGETAIIKPREITIYSLELLSYVPPAAKIVVHCSSGTYIRALARDLAVKAGSRAHLHALKRTQVGGFFLENAVFSNSEDTLRTALSPINKRFFDSMGVKILDVTEKTALDIRRGRPLASIMQNAPETAEMPPVPECCPENGGEAIAVFHEQEFVAMLHRRGFFWKYGFVRALHNS